MLLWRYWWADTLFPWGRGFTNSLRLLITIAGMEYFVGGPVLLVLAGHWVDGVERLVWQLEGLAKFVALVAEKIWVNIDLKRRPF